MIWGRRRIGKTRLLLEWVRRHKGLYTVADQSAAPMQRRYAAESISERFPGFAEVDYPSWRSLFVALTKAALLDGWQGPVVFDELPYWITQDKSLASVLQAWLDHDAKTANLTVALSGSAQNMMHGLTLNHDAPLYGRASELMRLSPIPVGYLRQVMPGLSAKDIVKTAALWGGVPRYWELVQPFGGDIETAVDELLLNPLGVLHEEPNRLLAMELPTAASLRPVLDAIGMGANKISEIAGRLGLPSTALSGQMQRLQELDLVKRELPFGEPEKRSKKSLYKIADPMMRAWFRLVAPKRAFLAATDRAGRLAHFEKQKQQLYSEGFEDLAREAVPKLAGSCLDGIRFGPAGRYWAGNGPEWDVVALSEEGNHLLLGEVKWHEQNTDEQKVRAAYQSLLKKGVPAGLNKEGLQIVHAVFVSKLSDSVEKERFPFGVIEAEEMVAAMG